MKRFGLTQLRLYQKSWPTNECHCRSAKLHVLFGKAAITVYGGGAVGPAMDLPGVPPEALQPHTVLDSLRVSTLSRSLPY